MKAKPKIARRIKPAADSRPPADDDAHDVIAEMLREDHAPHDRPSLPLGTILQSTRDGKTVFRLSLLCRTKLGNDLTITEIERRFREDTTSTYTPESVAEEILWWGIPNSILENALREPDNAGYLRTLHRVFPGAIFCFRKTLGSFTRHAVAALVSNDASKIKEAKRWLNTVLHVHHKQQRQTIALGVRHLGIFPRLYEEVVFLRNVAKGLRKLDLYSHLSGEKYRESIIPMICNRLNIPRSRIVNNWLTTILNIEKSEARVDRPISHAAQIIADCTNQETCNTSSPSTGYGATSIRSMVKTIHPDWKSRRKMIEADAKDMADQFIESVVASK